MKRYVRIFWERRLSRRYATPRYEKAVNGTGSGIGTVNGKKRVDDVAREVLAGK